MAFSCSSLVMKVEERTEEDLEDDEAETAEPRGVGIGIGVGVGEAPEITGVGVGGVIFILFLGLVSSERMEARALSSSLLKAMLRFSLRGTAWGRHLVCLGSDEPVCKTEYALSCPQAESRRPKGFINPPDPPVKSTQENRCSSRDRIRRMFSLVWSLGENACSSDQEKEEHLFLFSRNHEENILSFCSLVSFSGTGVLMMSIAKNVRPSIRPRS